MKRCYLDYALDSVQIRLLTKGEKDFPGDIEVSEDFFKRYQTCMKEFWIIQDKLEEIEKATISIRNPIP